MINLNEIIETTATSYKPQFSGKASKYYDAVFFAPTVRLGEMYLIKYAEKEYNSTLNPFKARYFK